MVAKIREKRNRKRNSKESKQKVRKTRQKVKKRREEGLSTLYLSNPLSRLKKGN